MKLCITSKGLTLEAEMDPRFGRCAYFIFVDSETLNFETIENVNAQTKGGAGIQAGQLVCEKKADIIITGQVGPNAFDTLKAADIKVITISHGTIKTIIEKYKNGELTTVDTPTVESHYGMN